MKARLLIAAALIALAAGCTPRSACTIQGVIEDPDNRDGEWIFLVPAGPHQDADVDSAIVKGGRFTFTPDSVMVASIRLTMKRRLGLQELLVVTEPGTVKAVISADSHCSGTPQNDSIQVWKDLTMQLNSLRSSVAPQHLKDSVYTQYKERTWAIAHGLGDDSVLGKFLLGYYPDKRQ